MVLEIIFILTIHLRDQHVFMQQSQKILNVSNIFETNFLKIKNHFQEAGVFFLVKSTRLPRQKPVLRQMEWGVPSLRMEFYPVTTFLKILFQFKNL